MIFELKERRKKENLIFSENTKIKSKKLAYV
jgi:hypothetical protein